MSPNNNDSDTLNDLERVREEREYELSIRRERNTLEIIGIIHQDHGTIRLLKVTIAFIAILVMAFFLALLKHSWFEEERSCYLVQCDAGLLGQALAIVVPAVAVTSIMTALVIGAFRTPRSTVIDNILSQGGRAAITGTGGSG